MLHLGGDEVRYDCWKHSDGGYIDKWMASHGLSPGDYAGLQAYFEQRMVQLVRNVSDGKKRTVLWEDNSEGGASNSGRDTEDATMMEKVRKLTVPRFPETIAGSP